MSDRSNARRRAGWSGGGLLVLALAGLLGCPQSTGEEPDGGGGDAGPRDAGVEEPVEEPEDFEWGLAYQNDLTQIFVVDGADWSTERELFADVEALRPRGFAFSPDNQTLCVAVADASDVGRAGGLLTAPSGGGAFTQLMEEQGPFTLLQTPVYGPTGAWVYFAFKDENTTTSIGRIRSDGSGAPERITDAADTRLFSSPSLDIDGNLYVAVRAYADPYDWEIGRIDPASGAYTTMVSEVPGLIEIVSRVEISPDGTRLAFDAFLDREGPVKRVVIQDLGTGERLELAPSSYSQIHPRWVDTDRLVFLQSQDALGSSPELVLTSLSEGTFTTIREGPHVQIAIARP